MPLTLRTLRRWLRTATISFVRLASLAEAAIRTPCKRSASPAPRRCQRRRHTRLRCKRLAALPRVRHSSGTRLSISKSRHSSRVRTWLGLSKAAAVPMQQADSPQLSQNTMTQNATSRTACVMSFWLFSEVRGSWPVGFGDAPSESEGAAQGLDPLWFWR